MKILIEYDIPDDFKPRQDGCADVCPFASESNYGYCSEESNDKCEYEREFENGKIKETV